MRRVRYHSHGGPVVLAIEEAGIPEPGPGQVLIRTEVLEAVGGQMLHQSLGLLAPFGRVVAFGASVP